MEAFLGCNHLTSRDPMGISPSEYITLRGHHASEVDAVELQFYFNIDF